MTSVQINIFFRHSVYREKQCFRHSDPAFCVAHEESENIVAAKRYCKDLKNIVLTMPPFLRFFISRAGGRIRMTKKGY